VGIGGLVVTIAADERRIVAMDGAGLQQVERLALRHAFDHVDEDDVAELLLDRVLRDAGADVAGADHGDLGPAIRHAEDLGLAHLHQSFAILSMMAVPNSEHFTSLAPSISRAKS